MNKPKLTQARIAVAFAIAIIADFVQLPLSIAEASVIGFVFGEAADFIIDVIVMIVTSLLLGFHWILLPSFFVEVIPGLDLIPTWTGCVAFLVWQRKKEQQQHPPIIEINSAPQYRSVPSPTSAQTRPMTVVSAEPHPVSVVVEATDARLSRLVDLRQRGIITEEEYLAKRRAILDSL